MKDALIVVVVVVVVVLNVDVAFAIVTGVHCVSPDAGLL